MTHCTIAATLCWAGWPARKPSTVFAVFTVFRRTWIGPKTVERPIGLRILADRPAAKTGENGEKRSINGAKTVLSRFSSGRRRRLAARKTAAIAELAVLAGRGNRP